MRRPLIIDSPAQTLRVWDAEDGAALAVLRGHMQV